MAFCQRLGGKQLAINSEREKILEQDLSTVDGIITTLGLIYGEMLKRQAQYTVWIDKTIKLADSFDAAAKAQFAELAICLSELSNTVIVVINEVLNPILADWKKQQFNKIKQQMQAKQLEL